MSCVAEAAASKRLPATTTLNTCPEASVKLPKSSVLTCLTPEAAAVVTSVPSRVIQLARPAPTAWTVKGALSAVAVSVSLRFVASAATVTGSPASMRVSSSASTASHVWATGTTRATGEWAEEIAATRPLAISCRVAEPSAV